MTTLIATIIALSSSLLAAVFAAADGALLALDPADNTLSPSLRSLAERRERPHRALAFARILAHLVAGCAAASALRFSDRSLGVSLLIAVPVALVAVLVSESIARSIGDATSAGTLERLSPVVRAVERILSPVVVVGTWLDNILQSLIPPSPVEEDREATAEQFRQIVAAEADVTDAEETIIHGVFSLGDTAVHEVMVPRVNLVGIERTTPWSDVLARVRSSEHARFPVFEDTLDEITGILYAKDLLPAAIADEEPADGWATLVRPAVFIPASKTIDQQLRDFQSSRTHIAVVVDEFGGTAGIVTIEDILEEIVGEIRDEYDVEAEPIVDEGNGNLVVSGKVSVDEVADRLGVEIEREGFETVGGYLLARLGRMPYIGERFEIDDLEVEVLDVERRRINKVRLRRRVPATESEAP